MRRRRLVHSSLLQLIVSFSEVKLKKWRFFHFSTLKDKLGIFCPVKQFDTLAWSGRCAVCGHEAISIRHHGSVLLLQQFNITANTSMFTWLYWGSNDQYLLCTGHVVIGADAYFHIDRVKVKQIWFCLFVSTLPLIYVIDGKIEASDFMSGRNNVGSC